MKEDTGGKQQFLMRQAYEIFREVKIFVVVCYKTYLVWWVVNQN